MSETQSNSEKSRIEPEFSEPRDGHERATGIVEDRGLPDDNPFSEMVQELHDNGRSWRDIYEMIAPAADVVDAAAREEGTELLPEWKVAVVVPDEHATSGKRYKYYERCAQTAQDAERRVKQHTGYPVEESETEQIGVAKVS